MNFRAASDQSLLIQFGDRISIEASSLVTRLVKLLESEPIANIRNLHPAYCSLLVKFDGLRSSHAEMEHALRRHLERLDSISMPEPREIEIPVCYGGEYGPDLEDVALLRAMSPSDVVDRQAAVEYLVYFLGFVPGFAYLGGLPEELATPRLASPRRRVPPGSVGIGGSQCGVYPSGTPGGWRLIGRTPLAMFRVDRDPPAVLEIGDRVRFVPISADRFEELEREWR